MEWGLIYSQNLNLENSKSPKDLEIQEILAAEWAKDRVVVWV